MLCLTVKLEKRKDKERIRKRDRERDEDEIMTVKGSCSYLKESGGHDLDNRL